MSDLVSLMKSHYSPVTKHSFNIPTTVNTNKEIHTETIRRSDFTKKYGSVLPPEFCEWNCLLNILAHNRVLSINSGLGYWEHLLQISGISVICTDISPPPNPFTLIYPLDAISAVKLFTSVNCLLSIWPLTNSDNDFVLNSLSIFKGNLFILVGENRLGCTASESLFDELELNWTQLHKISHPNFYSIYSFIAVYSRV